VSGITLTRASGHQYGLQSYARAREDAAGAIASEGSGKAAANTAAAGTHNGRDTRTGRFKPGHRFWEARTSSGPAPKFADGEALWTACVEYFDWVNEHPLYRMQLVTYKGRSKQVPVSRMRAMTKGELCSFLSIARSTWNAWKRDRPDLELAIDHAESIIWSWNFEGAAAGLLDPGIVLRQLGMDRKAEAAGRDGGGTKYGR
jgi:hypothetical protein